MQCCFNSVYMKAIAAVNKGESIKTAAIKFNVPHSAQHNRVTGKVKMGSPPSYVIIEKLTIFWLGYAHSLH